MTTLRFPREQLGFALAALALAAVTGILAATVPAAAPAPVVLLLAAVAATSIPGARVETFRGGTAGLLLLAILNGIPGVDLAGRTVPGGVRLQDGAVALLVLFLVVWREQDRASPPASPLRQWLTLWCVLFGAWWVLTMVRTVVFVGDPLLQSALLGRDFLYFAVLFPVLLRTRLTPRVTHAFLVVVASGLCVFALAEIVTALRLTNLSFLTHSNIEIATGGVVRVYASMNELVTVGLCLSLGVVLLARDGALRRRAALLLLLFVLAFLLQLTRANYVGIFVAGAGVIAWWMVFAPATWRGRLRRRAAAAAVGGAVVLGAALVLVPGTADNPAVGAVATRVQTGIVNVNESSGNVGYRKDVYHTMLGVLGGDWPVGLGFLHPATHYFADLPSGSIRNSDVGLLNVLMTTGLVGSLLLFLVPVLVLVKSFEKARRVGPSATLAAVVVFGLSVWVLATLLTSITLITLFSVNGLVLTSFVLRGAVAAVEDELG